MTQTTIDESLFALHNGTATSRLGAQAAQPAVAAQCLVVLNYLRSRPDGATNTEIAQATGLPLHAVCGRRNELVRTGYAEVRGKRKSKAGIANAVVHATPLAIAGRDG